jgi:transcriptional regulator with XRE-family HTH domain
MLIKQLRRQRHWSQEQLADMSGLSVRKIQRVENGNKASLETLKCLAAVFEVDLTMLTDRITLTDKDSSEVPACRVGSTATVTARVSGPDRRREHDLRIRAGVIP